MIISCTHLDEFGFEGDQFVNVLEKFFFFERRFEQQGNIIYQLSIGLSVFLKSFCDIPVLSTENLDDSASNEDGYIL